MDTVEEGQSSARAAIDGVNGALQSMNVLRGGLGSSESRLLSAISNLQVARENLLAAESRIRDVDVATEAAELTRLNILQQTGAAVLAHFGPPRKRFVGYSSENRRSPNLRRRPKLG